MSIRLRITSGGTPGTEWRRAVVQATTPRGRCGYGRSVPVRAAVWDLGSSSFQVLVCDADACGTLEPVMRRRALLNLGFSVGAKGSIPPDRVAASVAAASRLRRALDEVQPDVVVALATAAIRDASNGPEVVTRLERVLGTPVRVLDGAEEARLCFAGQRAGVWIGRAPVLGLDLGGGSFEVAVGDAGHVMLALSAPVGATRLQGELATGDPLTAADRSAIEARTADVLVPVRAALADYPGVTTRVVVSGGTARALARLAMARTRGSRAGRSGEVNQVELPAPQVAELTAQLAVLDLKERLALPGMPPRRAPMLPIGAAILATFAGELGVDHFVVSEWGLREGALLDAVARR
jgi:exopolyphosphatase/guanosine-5'-triphosphate,3'-diphosphate pyrophosphatase